MEKGPGIREPRWTESIAVGDKPFIDETRKKHGIKAIGRKTVEMHGVYDLRESQRPYTDVFTPEKCTLRQKNYCSIAPLDF